MNKTSKKRILIVDDEISFTWLLKMNLEDTGEYEVTVVNNPEKALTLARKLKPDLIITDVEMPQMFGHELAEKIHKEEELKDKPIIFLTATQSEETLKKIAPLIEQGRVFSKPVNVDEVIEFIEENFAQ